MRAEVTARQCPAGRTRICASPQRLTARGLYTSLGGAKRHQTSLCSFPRIRAPGGLQGTQSSPKPVHPAGPRSSGQTTSGSDAAIPPPTQRKRRREENAGPREKGVGPETARSPARPRQPGDGPAFSRWPSAGGGRAADVAGRAPRSQAGPAVPGSRPPAPRGGQGRARRGLTRRRGRPSAAGPGTPASAFPGTGWACDPPRGSWAAIRYRAQRAVTSWGSREH